MLDPLCTLCALLLATIYGFERFRTKRRPSICQLHKLFSSPRHQKQQQKQQEKLHFDFNRVGASSCQKPGVGVGFVQPSYVPIAVQLHRFDPASIFESIQLVRIHEWEPTPASISFWQCRRRRSKSPTRCRTESPRSRSLLHVFVNL